MIPVMILLAIATIIGMAASSTSNFEIQIAANERMYKQNFVRADGANQQGAQLIENAKAAGGQVLRDRNEDWISFYDDSVDYLDPDNYSYPDFTKDPPDKGIPNTKLMVVDHGGAVGTEISMGSPYMHAMNVYGRYDSTNPPGRVIIESEYRVRF
ncbi:MAG: hypothetical protein DSY90_09625 [Deltaproteobacteria bacterium]|nr:MAG: hypothetical protein DSY90_09625 [Deltaproteobacteria bacterium]